MFLKFYYVITDILEVLMRHNQLARPQIGQIMQLRITMIQNAQHPKRQHLTSDIPFSTTHQI